MGQFLLKVKTSVQVIIPINRSFVKQLKVTEAKRNQKQTGSEVTTFTVPFALGKSKENATFKINTFSNKSKKN